MFEYNEPFSAGDKYRQAYLDGIDRLIKQKQALSADSRREMWDDIFEKQDKYRDEFFDMLGWPLTEKKRERTEMSREFVTETDGVKIYRTVMTILDTVPVYGMLFTFDESEKHPLVVASHGGLGTPELVSGICPAGSCNYNDMVHRVVKKGANVYAPQLLMWDVEDYKVFPEGYKSTDAMRRHDDNRLKELGSSITAIEVYGIMCALDCLCGLPYVDADRIGMTGLSYGGFYTLYTAAADTRIKASVSSCFFNDRFRYDFSDWSWKNSGNIFGDDEVLALVYPRSICLQVAENDPLFSIDAARETFERFRSLAGEKADYAYLDVFKGSHEFSWDDGPIEKMMAELNK